MYAIVRAGGRQEKVAVGDVITLDRVPAEPGEQVSLPAVLVVDGDKVTSEQSKLASWQVTGEVVEHERGPKIRIMHYRNKTGYKRRQGHRQSLTKVKVTGIETGK
ncbi:MAG: 50S ribosomal protein L21 [Streptosporangiales bacterium]|nr:50S ribosomal protein L21 [Streptosporangiales bacterium]